MCDKNAMTGVMGKTKRPQSSRLCVDVHVFGSRTSDQSLLLLCLELLLGQLLLFEFLLFLLVQLVDNIQHLALVLEKLLSSLALGRGQQVLVLCDELAVGLEIALLVAAHAVLVELALALGADLRYALHGLEGGGDQVAVVANGDVAAGGKGEGAVDGHLLAVGGAERFCPGELAGVTLHLEL
jgi:hypothetical protein